MPMFIDIRGRPGRSAGRISRRHRWRGSLALALGLIGGALLLTAGAPGLGLVAVGAGWLVRRRATASAGRAASGHDAEVEVAAILRRARPDALLFDVRLPGRRGDVDAIVLGPMAATIEVKRASGRIRFVGDDGIVADGRRLPGAPLRQALAAAVATRHALGIDAEVQAVLCLTGMRGRPRIVPVGRSEVWVTSSRRLRQTLRRLPRCLDARAVRSATARLETGAT